MKLDKIKKVNPVNKTAAIFLFCFLFSSEGRASDDGATDGRDTTGLLATQMQIVMKCQSGYICHCGLIDLGSFVM